MLSLLCYQTQPLWNHPGSSPTSNIPLPIRFIVIIDTLKTLKKICKKKKFQNYFDIYEKGYNVHFF